MDMWYRILNHTMIYGISSGAWVRTGCSYYWISVVVVVVVGVACTLHFQ